MGDTVLTAGERFPASVDVTCDFNSGPCGAGTVKFWISTDTVIDPFTDTLLDEEPHAPLDHGDRQTFLATLTAPVAVGPYWLYACVEEQPDELDLNNNCATLLPIDIIAQNADLYEPDNAFTKAGSILNGEMQSRKIIPATDVDYVTFNLPYPADITLETSGGSPGIRYTSVGV